MPLPLLTTGIINSYRNIKFFLLILEKVSITYGEPILLSKVGLSTELDAVDGLSLGSYECTC